MTKVQHITGLSQGGNSTGTLLCHSLRLWFNLQTFSSCPAPKVMKTIQKLEHLWVPWLIFGQINNKRQHRIPGFLWQMWSKQKGIPDPTLAIRDGERTGKMDPKGMNPVLVLSFCHEPCNPGYPALPLFPEQHPRAWPFPEPILILQWLHQPIKTDFKI